jgi:NitT/TauT family transport system substrate-binding protein
MKKALNNEGMSRRTFVKTAGAVAAVGAGSALVGCSSGSSSTASSASSASSSSSDASNDLIDLTIGYWGGSPCELPMYICFMKDYWKEAGINVTELLITSSTNELLANDEIDCFEVTPGNFQGILEGLNLKLIDTIHYGCFSGVTRADSGIKSAADLAGKKVATSGMGSVAYIETASLMARAGGDPSTIDWQQLSGSLMEQALQNGEVDAICNQDQIMQPILERNPDFVHYYYSAEDFSDTVCCFLGINSNTLAAQPEAADRLCKAWKMAMDYINEDVDKACEEALKAGYIGYFDDYQEAVLQLARDYKFGSHGEDVMRESLDDRYRQNVEAVLVKNAPDASDKEAYDEFINKAVENAMEYHGLG